MLQDQWDQDQELARLKQEEGLNRQKRRKQMKKRKRNWEVAVRPGSRSRSSRIKWVQFENNEELVMRIEIVSRVQLNRQTG